IRLGHLLFRVFGNRFASTHPVEETLLFALAKQFLGTARGGRGAPVTGLLCNEGILQGSARQFDQACSLKRSEIDRRYMLRDAYPYPRERPESPPGSSRSFRLPAAAQGQRIKPRHFGRDLQNPLKFGL